jgi:hypothetical protein
MRVALVFGACESHFETKELVCLCLPLSNGPGWGVICAFITFRSAIVTPSDTHHGHRQSPLGMLVNLGVRNMVCRPVSQPSHNNMHYFSSINEHTLQANFLSGLASVWSMVGSISVRWHDATLHTLLSNVTPHSPCNNTEPLSCTLSTRYISFLAMIYIVLAITLLLKYTKSPTKNCLTLGRYPPPLIVA